MSIKIAACRRDRGENVIAVDVALPGQANDLVHVIGAESMEVGDISPVVQTAVEDVVAIGSSVVVLEVQDRATEAIAKCPPKRTLVHVASVPMSTSRPVMRAS